MTGVFHLRYSQTSPVATKQSQDFIRLKGIRRRDPPFPTQVDREAENPEEDVSLDKPLKTATTSERISDAFPLMRGKRNSERDAGKPNASNRSEMLDQFSSGVAMFVEQSEMARIGVYPTSRSFNLSRRFHWFLPR